MRVSCILNNKGGVAKTTTVINMAAIIAADLRQPVLVIDADSQANTTTFFGGVGLGMLTLTDLLRGSCKDPLRVIHDTRYSNISIIPADESLMDLDLSAIRGKIADMCALDALLRRVRSSFSYVLIDCPPAFNAASAAALLAADDVIIPIKLDAFSLRGMANLMRQVQGMRSINPELRVAGLLPTMTYNSAAMNEAMQILRGSDFPIFPPIRKTAKVDDMTFAETPLIESSPRSAACVDYRKMVRVYTEGGAQHGGI